MIMYDHETIRDRKLMESVDVSDENSFELPPDDIELSDSIRESGSGHNYDDLSLELQDIKLILEQGGPEVFYQLGLYGFQDKYPEFYNSILRDFLLKLVEVDDEYLDSMEALDDWDNGELVQPGDWGALIQRAELLLRGKNRGWDKIYKGFVNSGVNEDLDTDLLQSDEEESKAYADDYELEQDEREEDKKELESSKELVDEINGDEHTIEAEQKLTGKPEDLKEGYEEDDLKEAKIYKEDISGYTPWSGAVDTFDKIKEAGLLDELDALIDELYPEGISETQLNDILWFEPDFILDSLGLGEDEEEEEETEEDEDDDFEQDDISDDADSDTKEESYSPHHDNNRLSLDESLF